MSPFIRYRPLVLGMALCLALPACVPIPVNSRAEDSRDNISERALHAITIGKTTRSELIFAFGEPDRVQGDGQYAYRRTRDLLIGVVPAEGSKPVVLLQKTTWFVVHFDAHGVVSDIEQPSALAATFK